MFTGIVEELGTVRSLREGRISIEASLVVQDMAVGDSIAVSGCCLTVVEMSGSDWSADVSAETLSRTMIGNLNPGDRVNLERAVPLGGRLGGHLVQGHVDTVGQIVSEAPDLAVSIPNSLARYLVEKGSIAVDGVSLTVVSVHNDGEHSVFTSALIPLTCQSTSLGDRRVGDKVNLEVDLFAKYVERLVGPFKLAKDSL